MLCYKISSWAEANFLTSMECKRTVPSIPANIEKDVGGIMPGATPMNIEKVTWIAFNGEVFYSVDYGKLKTCGYCVKYLTKHIFGQL